MGGENFSSSTSHIPHQDCECLDQCLLFTAAGLVQCLSIDIWDGETRLRLEFILYNGHRKLTLESWVGKIWASTSHIPHQECECLDQCMQFTAAGLVQCLSIDIMNGETRLRFELIVYNAVTASWLWSNGWGKYELALLTFHTKIVCVWYSA